MATALPDAVLLECHPVAGKELCVHISKYRIKIFTRQMMRKVLKYNLVC